jgi:hypothetical protein
MSATIEILDCEKYENRDECLKAECKAEYHPDKNQYQDPISFNELGNYVVQTKDGNNTHCYNDDDEDHGLRVWVETNANEPLTRRVLQPPYPTDKWQAPSVSPSTFSNAPTRISDRGVDHILRHATNEREAMALFRNMELDRRFYFGEINSLSARGFGEVAVYFALDTVSKFQQYHRMERGTERGSLSDENIRNFRPSFEPNSFIALVNNGTDLMRIHVANWYMNASINYGTAIAPADTSPDFQRGHRVILHRLIAGETERNREAVRPAQNMYYEKFVKPYEEREGIVVQDWREYNEEFIADHTRGN